MKAMAIVFAATVTACAATTSSSQVQAISAEPNTFTAYRTFGFRISGEPPFPSEVSPGSFEVGRRMHDLVATALAHKGYREAGTSPDFLIRLSSGTLEVDATQTYDGMATGENDSFILSEMVVDAFDGSTAQQVWHATAEVEINPHGINKPAIGGIGTAVGQMLAPFPVRSEAVAER
jgi:hypothetical protein